MSLFTEIDHVAVAVRDLDAAVAWHVDVFGMEVVHREPVEHDGVEEALLRVADSYLQLLAPTRPDSPVARFLDRRGEGLHHVAYRVDDCAAALQAAVAAGARPIDQVPRPGGRGTKIGRASCRERV
jgi:methylmalonyl-CoA/ethylmalonyl-CoA epimerase